MDSGRAEPGPIPERARKRDATLAMACGISHDHLPADLDSEAVNRVFDRHVRYIRGGRNAPVTLPARAAAAGAMARELLKPKHPRGRRKLGVTCGLAAAGIVAAVWGSVYAHPGNFHASFAGPARAACCGSKPVSNGSGESAKAGTMTVRVQASGGLRSLIGDRDMQVTMPLGSTVAALGERLAAEYPVLGPMVAALAVAGSDEMLPPDRVLFDGQFVELIPPMSGG